MVIDLIHGAFSSRNCASNSAIQEATQTKRFLLRHKAPLRTTQLTKV